MSETTNVIYLGKDKSAVVRGLEFLLEEDFNVVTAVGPVDSTPPPSRPRFVKEARQMGVTTTSEPVLYRTIENDGEISGVPVDEIDVVVSYLFWKKIRPPLIRLPTVGCINFHPAPLPEFRGLGGFNVGLCQEVDSWGVSAHFVDETFDTGDIIEVFRFDINPERETALSLDQKSQDFLFELFQKVMDTVAAGEPLDRRPQTGGNYYSREDFEQMREVGPEDDADDIERKIRAFWYPPYPGATIELRGREFTLVDEQILQKIAPELHDSD